MNEQKGVPNNWTLEKELTKLSNQPDLNSALIELTLITAEESGAGAIELTHADWYRAGSETYICNFSIRTRTQTKRFVLKAVVAFSTAQQLDEILRTWVERRQLLQTSGVKTPTLHYAGTGVILEEYIPYTLLQFLEQGPTPLSLIKSAAEYVGVLSKLRFSPIDAFSDLRTDGYQVIPVDFGEDLGPPGMAQSVNDELFLRLLRWLQENGSKLEHPQIEELHTAFTLASSECNSIH
jgi:hypothetical protein